MVQEQTRQHLVKRVLGIWEFEGHCTRQWHVQTRRGGFRPRVERLPVSRNVMQHVQCQDQVERSIREGQMFSIRLAEGDLGERSMLAEIGPGGGQNRAIIVGDDHLDGIIPLAPRGAV